MKKIFLAVMALVTFLNVCYAQNDTIYFIKNGKVINKQSVKPTDVDSVIFYQPTVIVQNTVTDIDGNIYNTITIGKQTWMVENLKTTKYNDGTPIPNVTDNKTWAKLPTGAYCNYDNLENNAATYGRLYNWYAVNTGKLAPKGWHVPTDDDWVNLRDYLIANGYNYDGTKTGNYIGKSLCAITNWNISSEVGDAGAAPQNNNSTGFTALPGGERDGYDGVFYKIGKYGNWWTSSERNTGRAYSWLLGYDTKGLNYNDGWKESGFSVRLVKD